MVKTSKTLMLKKIPKILVGARPMLSPSLVLREFELMIID